MAYISLFLEKNIVFEICLVCPGAGFMFLVKNHLNRGNH